MSERKMGHVQDFKVYLFILLALFGLTVVTVWVSYFDFGVFNDLVAVLIATVKASLVVLFFMHGKYENRMTWAFIYYPIILLLLLLGALFLDYGFRDDADRAHQAISATTLEKHHEEGTHEENAEPHGETPKNDH